MSEFLWGRLKMLSKFSFHSILFFYSSSLVFISAEENENWNCYLILLWTVKKMKVKIENGIWFSEFVFNIKRRRLGSHMERWIWSSCWSCSSLETSVIGHRLRVAGSAVSTLKPCRIWCGSHWKRSDLVLPSLELPPRAWNSLDLVWISLKKARSGPPCCQIARHRNHHWLVKSHRITSAGLLDLLFLAWNTPDLWSFLLRKWSDLVDESLELLDFRTKLLDFGTIAVINRWSYHWVPELLLGDGWRSWMEEAQIGWGGRESL